FVDTVGFIQKLPHDLVAAFRATLEEVVEADLLVHVIDGSHPRWSEQMAAVEDVLVELGAAETLRINAINKIDRITREALRDIEAEVPGAIPISARRGRGPGNCLPTIARPRRDRIRRSGLGSRSPEAGALARAHA